MRKMEYRIVFDISSIIWDEQEFESNPYQYYKLLCGVSSFFGKVDLDNILMRIQLSYEMIHLFPFKRIKNLEKYDNTFKDIGQLVYRFIGKISSESKTYVSVCEETVKTNPSIIKPYFNSNVKKELCYLITKIHSEDESDSKYFTFNYLWNGKDNLKTETKNKTNTYETIVADNGNDLEDFFNKYTLVFEHKSPKHDCSIHKNKEAWDKSNDKSNFPSQLSSYCDKNKGAVQEILNKRYHKCFGKELYYGYDKVNNVYVAFRITLNNEYHAYDIYDIESVPNEVKKAFNIWKY